MTRQAQTYIYYDSKFCVNYVSEKRGGVAAVSGMKGGVVGAPGVKGHTAAMPAMDAPPGKLEVYSANAAGGVHC